MTVLSIFKHATSGPELTEVVDLASLLVELQQFGQPRVGVYGGGKWHCSVDMNVSAVGVKFQAASGFDHDTPTEAVIVCRDRIRAALASLGDRK